MPEFLEYRYNKETRTIMSVYLMALTVIAVLVTVLYSGSRGLDGVFGFSGMLEARYSLPPEQAQLWAMWGGAWLIGIVAGIYTIYGGLKAVVWSDLLQGSALMLGGAIVLYLGLKYVGGGELGGDGGVAGGNLLDGWQNFRASNTDKLHTIKPASDPDMPWTIMIVGIWIPNFFYWGMNQFITQRTLGARSLADGQKGIFLACIMKLIIPFIIVVPGIIAFQTFGDQIIAQAAGDQAKAGELAYPFLIRQIMPPMLRGVMLAALAGRIATAVIAVAACLLAPLPGRFEGVFNYIQEIWGSSRRPLSQCSSSACSCARPPRFPARSPCCWDRRSMRSSACPDGSWTPTDTPSRTVGR